MALSETTCNVDVLDPACILLRGLLSPPSQASLFSFIEHNDRTPWSDLPRPMVPSPKTLLFGDDLQPVLRYKVGEESLIGEESLVSEMVRLASEIVIQNSRSTSSTLGDQLSAKMCKSLSMAAIRYEAPDGRFPPHVDHCADSLVFLTSIGCTARFMVKGPSMAEKLTFDFRSGDLLVFDASTEANILHGVTGVEEGSCPVSLEGFSVLRWHRYGVQVRLTFESP